MRASWETSHSSWHSAVYCKSIALIPCSWDDTYRKEIKTFEATSNQGTVWFSDARAEEKVVDYLEKLSTAGLLLKKRDPEAPAASSFLDLGSGNGHMLFALRESGWEGHMLGVDYSSASVALASEICSTKIMGIYAALENDGVDLGSGILPVSFKLYDIFNPRPTAGMLAGGFDVLLDKGTFDAVSLSSDRDANGKRLSESYPEKIKHLIRVGGILIITSCNWTEDELSSWFTKDTSSKNGFFVLKDKIKYKSYSFGGKSGQSVVTMAFEKRLKS